MKNAVVRTWLVYLFTLLCVAALNIDGVGSWYANKGEGREEIRIGLAKLKQLHAESGIGSWLIAMECAAGPAFEGSYKDKSKCQDIRPEVTALAVRKPPEVRTTALMVIDQSSNASERDLPWEEPGPFPPKDTLGGQSEIMHEPDGAAQFHIALETPSMSVRPRTEEPGSLASLSAVADEGSQIASILPSSPRAGLSAETERPRLDGEGIDVESPKTETFEQVSVPPPAPRLSSTPEESRMQLAALQDRITSPQPTDPGSDKGLCNEALRAFDFQSVLLVGDSLAHGLALSLGRDLKDRKGAVFTFVAKVSSGLNNPNVFNWEKTMRMLIEQGTPDLVLVMMGVNDANNHIREGNRLCAVGTPQWGEAYENRVENFLRIASEHNVRVCWIGVPVVREEGLQNRVLMANMAARNACTRLGNCRFIDTFEALCDENRRYTNYLKEPDGSSIRIRAKDGIHFSMEGSNLLSKYILHKLETGGPSQPSAQN